MAFILILFFCFIVMFLGTLVLVLIFTICEPAKKQEQKKEVAGIPKYYICRQGVPFKKPDENEAEDASEGNKNQVD